MDCARARATLWPTDRPRLAGDDVVEAARHVESCPECGRSLAYDGALRSAFERLKREAPRSVRERVYDVLASERAGRRTSTEERKERRKQRAFLLLAPALLAVALISVTVYGILGSRAPAPAELRESDAAAYIDDYMRRAVREDHVTTSDPDEVQRFLARELGLPVRVVTLEGFAIEGAEVCLVEGIRGALVVYRRGGEAVSYYVLPRRDGPPRAPRVRTPSQDPGVASVVTWATTGAEHALVGPVSAAQLLAAARGALTGG